MRWNLKIYWLNFAVLLSVLAGSAVWQAREADKSTLETPSSSPDGRYHWAEVGREVLLVIRDGEYQEIVTPPPEGRNEVTSSGFCYRDGSDLLLSELQTGAKRRLRFTWDSLRELNSKTGEHRLFERCEHLSARRSLGENPYSVDGVKLGMTKAEVEQAWGPLVQKEDREREFKRSSHTENSISLDDDGRVESVWGKALFEDGVRLIDTNSRFDQHRNIGHERKFHNICGYRYSTKAAHRTIDDYQVMFLGYNREELKRDLALDFDRFSEHIDVDAVAAVELSYRYR